MPSVDSVGGSVAQVSRLVRARRFLADDELPVSVRSLRQSDLKLHRHEFTELVIVLAGSGDHLFDEHRFPILAGDAFVVDVNHAHGYRDTRDLQIANVLFDESWLLEHSPELAVIPSYQAMVHLEPLARRRLDFGGKLRLDSVAMEEAKGLLRRLESELASRREGGVSLAGALLVELIVLLCRAYCDDGSEQRRDLADIGRVIAYLEHQYAAPIELAQLLELVAMSERSLLRKFAYATGTTPIQYLLRVRIAHAARFLRATNLSVTEIAGRVGFDDSNYFARQFRQILGASPTGYRRGAQHG